MQFIKLILFFLIFLFSNTTHSQVSFPSLLREMADRSLLAQFPQPAYQSLQASSYNRESVVKDSAGWFADSDGIGFIRKENTYGKEEWVVMEHEGAGVITKMWAPYFYYGGLDDLEGPIINIYLDGNTTPVISENYFKLITGKGSFPPPFARKTARAGDSYLPIPFAKSCRITFNKKPFYNIINYRAYAAGTPVQSFTKDQLRLFLPVMDAVSQSLHAVYSNEKKIVAINKTGVLKAGKSLQLSVNKMGAVQQLEIRFDPVQFTTNPQLLRSLVLKASFDGEETIWVPLGDFFGSANALNPFQTFTRTVNAVGQMICTWTMPFKSAALFTLENLSKKPFTVEKFEIKYSSWKWDDRSMHFHAGWHSDELLPGNVFKDWNFIDIKGKGVIVGDALTVLNPDDGWWGEGDEKIYVDNDWDKKFPTHFGTGTEDYYGWAGGENPGKDDIFSHPYLANIMVGSATNQRQGAKGFNICTRVRALDAIPFNNRIVFDMEALPGTQIRNAWNFLNYAAVVFWYALPGATSNTGSSPAEALKPMITLQAIDSMESKVKGGR
ncbi:MAG: DUF2961 domain-containing protein [Agriterribacter sp.]